MEVSTSLSPKRLHPIICFSCDHDLHFAPKVSIILPDSPKKYEALGIELLPDQKRAGVGVLVGLRTAVDRGMVPNDMYFNVTFSDSRCDITYGPKAFIDAVMEGANVLFGPSCEFSLGKKRLMRRRAFWGLSGA